MGTMRRFTILRLVIAVILIVSAFAGSYICSTLSGFYQKADNFSGAIARGDQMAAREDMKELEPYYELNKRLPSFLSRYFDKKVFQEAQVPHYQVAYEYLTGRYSKLYEQDLNEDDSYWGLYIRSNSKWRDAQKVFAQSLTQDPKTSKDQQKIAIDLVLSTKDDYEQAIKKRASFIPYLPASWNYDMTTNPEARMRGLMPKPAKVKLVLGEGKGKGPDGEEGDGPKGKGSRDLDKKKGDSPGPNNNPGTKREG